MDCSLEATFNIFTTTLLLLFFFLFSKYIKKQGFGWDFILIIAIILLSILQSMSIVDIFSNEVSAIITVGLLITTIFDTYITNLNGKSGCEVEGVDSATFLSLLGYFILLIFYLDLLWFGSELFVHDEQDSILLIAVAFSFIQKSLITHYKK